MTFLERAEKIVDELKPVTCSHRENVLFVAAQIEEACAEAFNRGQASTDYLVPYLKGFAAAREKARQIELGPEWEHGRTRLTRISEMEPDR